MRQGLFDPRTPAGRHQRIGVNEYQHIGGMRVRCTRVHLCGAAPLRLDDARARMPCTRSSPVSTACIDDDHLIRLRQDGGKTSAEHALLVQRRNDDDDSHLRSFKDQS